MANIASYQNWKISPVAKIGKYLHLPKLAYVTSCQIGKYRQMPNMASVAKILSVAKFGKFSGHLTCQNWQMLPVAKFDISYGHLLSGLTLTPVPLHILFNYKQWKAGRGWKKAHLGTTTMQLQRSRSIWEKSCVARITHDFKFLDYSSQWDLSFHNGS